ncbi:MAG TPA: hypothetical protein VF595_04335 [Tepidisphaeraceae bacterium]
MRKRAKRIRRAAIVLISGGLIAAGSGAAVPLAKSPELKVQTISSSQLIPRVIQAAPVTLRTTAGSEWVGSLIAAYLSFRYVRRRRLI